MRRISFLLLGASLLACPQVETNSQTAADAADEGTGADAALAGSAEHARDAGIDLFDGSWIDSSLPDSVEPLPDAAGLAPDRAVIPDAYEAVDASQAIPDWALGLTGRFAQRTRVAVLQTLGEMEQTEQTNVAWGISIVEWSGAGLVLRESFCHAEVEADVSVMVSIPDTMTRSMTPPEVELIADTQGSEVALRRPAVAFCTGAHLEDPENEALPTEADDPRVWDQDGDGNPGITTELLGGATGLALGEVYAIRRDRYTWTVTLQDDGSLHGLFTDTGEQMVIGADPEFFFIQPIIEPNPDASLSSILLVPVGAAYDCDRVMEEAEDLFES